MPNPELRLYTGPHPTSAEPGGLQPAAAKDSPVEPRGVEPDGVNAGRNRRRERELDRIAGAEPPKTVSVSLGSIIPLLLDAVENDRAWIRDFAEESVRIDADLYDVLLAYQQLRRPDAA